MNQFQNNNYNSFNSGYKRSYRRFKGIKFPLFFLFFTLIFLIVGTSIAISSSENKKLFENEPSIISEISKIDTYRDHDGDIHYTVYVTYVVDGISYTNNIFFYTSDMYIGKAVEIKYLQSDPNEIFVVGSENVSNVVLIVATIMNLIPVGFMISSVVNNRKLKQLIATGKKVRLNLMSFEPETNIYANGVNPIYLLCSNPITEEIFISNKYYYDTNKFSIGDYVNMYVDHEDESNFFLDTDNVERNNNSNIFKEN